MDLKIGHLTAPSSVNKAQTNRPKPRGIIIYRARTPDGGGCTDRATVRPAEEGGRSAAQRTTEQVWMLRVSDRRQYPL